MSDRTLTTGDVEAIADAIAQKVAKIVGVRSTTFGLVDARVLAEDLSVSIDHVYSHSTEFGAMRLGSGPMAPSRSIPIRRAKRSKSEGKRANGAVVGVATVSRVSRSLCDGLDGRVLVVRTRVSNRGFDVVRVARRLTVNQRAAEEGYE